MHGWCGQWPQNYFAHAPDTILTEDLVLIIFIMHNSTEFMPWPMAMSVTSKKFRLEINMVTSATCQCSSPNGIFKCVSVMFLVQCPRLYTWRQAKCFSQSRLTGSYKSYELGKMIHLYFQGVVENGRKYNRTATLTVSNVSPHRASGRFTWNTTLCTSATVGCRILPDMLTSMIDGEITLAGLCGISG